MKLQVTDMAGVTTYTDAVGEEICTQLSTSSKSMATICEEMGLTPRTVWRWLNNLPEFAVMYDRAKIEQTHFLAEETLAIADEPSKDLVEAMDKKLRVSARQWFISKRNIKTYGQNSTIEHDHKVAIAPTKEQYQQLLAAATREDTAEDIEHEEIN